MAFLPSVIQSFMYQISGTARCFYDQDPGLNQLQLRSFLNGVTKESKPVGDMVELK
jgi:hypothetical protein